VSSLTPVLTARKENMRMRNLTRFMSSENEINFALLYNEVSLRNDVLPLIVKFQFWINFEGILDINSSEFNINYQSEDQPCSI
jgi:hypothetical protein